MQDEHEKGKNGVGVVRPGASVYAECRGPGTGQGLSQVEPTDSSGNLIILIPNDSSVFYNLDTGRDRLPCTSPVQTYIDLVNVGGRSASATTQARLVEARNGP